MAPRPIPLEVFPLSQFESEISRRRTFAIPPQKA